MQIGCCWFDIKRTTLSNQQNDTSWKMPLVEFVVLELLVRFRDQVLSKEQLLQRLPEEHRTPAKLQEAIDRLRFFLGKQSAQLLETIDDQGFILHTRMKASINHTLSGPLAGMTKQKYGLLIAQILLLIIFMHSIFEPEKSIKPLNKHEITTSTGIVSYYPVPNEGASFADIEDLSSFFIQQLELCDTVLWDDVFVSFTHNETVSSIVLKRENAEGTEVRNVKGISSGASKDYIDQTWLKRTGICG
ncbi:helix-turn-helix domain-containing protein [Shewanella psychropiezotolerans]|uniref:Helix-turn-helix domain-containing protein n=1 Tax=Shewanella psychropiezotolerans TaxID=2593655 RepID=A0ABX5WX53_9GAMM|nr:winged helix-turn-helix domain-containing protein [Shewanella psychropiezotolerans]QDO82762.1 helix-turn-helix domain-containing protein [Shewanella psychropiezotolerans]